MVQILDSYKDNEYYIRYNDVVISIKSSSFGCLNDSKIKVLVNLLKLFNIESVSIIDIY